MQRITSASQPRSRSIRSGITFGLTLCSMARTQMRFGAPLQAKQTVHRVRKIAAQSAHHLNLEAGLDPVEQHHLHSLLNRLEASVVSLDSAMTPAALRAFTQPRSGQRLAS